MDPKRILKHLAMPDWMVRRAFPARVFQFVEQAVAKLEKAHHVELRVAVEGGLPLGTLLRGESARDRAIELFSRLRAWDTEDNTGVLIYVQYVDHRVEIVADRGIAAKVAQNEWDEACARMTREFREGRYEAGARAGIEAIAAILARHVAPPPEGDRDELPNQPTVL